MNADGSGAHPITPDMTCSGCFSRDGKRIAYVARAADFSSQIVTASADGSDAKPLKLAGSLYAAPRWLADGKTIEVESRAEAEGKAGVPAATAAGWQGVFVAVWVAGADGADLRRVSPPADSFHARGCGLDEDAESFVVHFIAPAAGGGASRAPCPRRRRRAPSVCCRVFRNRPEAGRCSRFRRARRCITTARTCTSAAPTADSRRCPTATTGSRTAGSCVSAAERIGRRIELWAGGGKHDAGVATAGRRKRVPLVSERVR